MEHDRDLYIREVVPIVVPIAVRIVITVWMISLSSSFFFIKTLPTSLEGGDLYSAGRMSGSECLLLRKFDVLDAEECRAEYEQLGYEDENR